jgi:flavodoxin
MKRILVVYYSRTGNTRTLAGELVAERMSINSTIATTAAASSATCVARGRR